jgi:cysteine synthase A
MGVAAVEPAGSAVLSGGEAGEHGIQGIGAGFVPDILDTEMIDRVVRVSDEDAIDYAREAAKRAGLLIGISSGANLAAAEIIAGGIKDSGKAVVTILPDGAERYLSGALLEDAE